jgi:UDP-N-acetylmuramate dehydrogenase
MSRHTSWHVGGPAEVFFNPRDRADLAAFLKSLPEVVPVQWVGLGSNLLVRDGGVSGVVISTVGTLDRLDRLNQTSVYCEAGVACARLAKQCVKWGLGPAEFFAGIPGTLGGALAMNAGAFGGEMSRVVSRVIGATAHGVATVLEKDSIDFGYRKSLLPQGFIISRVEFVLETGDANLLRDRMLELRARRASRQPRGLPNAGSIFKNPPGGFAGRLLESCGLKGERVGGAAFSDQHANFIVNLGDARASEVRTLIEIARQRVQERTGVWLEPEVRMVGDWG